MSTFRFFKFSLAIFIALIVLLLLTRNKVTQVGQIQELDTREAYLEQIGEIPSENDDNTIVQENAEHILNSDGDIEMKSDEQISDLEEIINNITPAKEESKNDDKKNNKEEEEASSNDNMPAIFLKYRNSTFENKSYCKFNYDLPYSLNYSNQHIAYPPQGGNQSIYRVLYNAIYAHDIENISSITYATHMSANYGNFIPELLKRWDGLVTIAAFVPDIDAAYFLEQINQFCYCEPEMHRLSIHLVTQERLPFSERDISFERPETCLPKDSSQLSLYRDFDDTITYPVNVLRNVARVSSLSKYILLSDSELMPSKDLAKSFLNFMETYNKTKKREVFVLPIFEVEEAESVPESKEELLRLIEDDKAIYFNGLVCKYCQKFPLFDQWLQSGYADNIRALVTVKRHDPYHRWEPIFIGTNEEPLYDEELSWEGFQDKMSQSLEMCLQDYYYTVLDNAFLCHWPGMKKQVPKNATQEEWRSGFITKNKEVYETIVQNLLSKYDNIAECKANFQAEIEISDDNKI